MQGAEVALEGVGLAYEGLWAVRGIDLAIALTPAISSGLR